MPQKMRRPWGKKRVRRDNPLLISGTVDGRDNVLSGTVD